MELSQIVNMDDVGEGLGQTVLAIGVFDGVHIGHRRLIADCRQLAGQLGAQSAILTFDIDPEEVFCTGSARKLLSNADRIQMLATLGADVVLVQRFDEALSHVGPHEFIASTILAHMQPLGIFVGANFRFGSGAAGDVGFLRDDLAGTRCVVMGQELLEFGGQPVTATRIRDLLQEGQLAQANQMLGRMHGFRATVAHGRQVGRTLGYPTANLVPTTDYATLADGVYAGYVKVHGTWFNSSISVGVPKTFGDIMWTIEAYLVDFDEDIYGQEVEVCFAKRLRPMVKFDSVEQLVAQIAADTNEAALLPPLV